MCVCVCVCVCVKERERERDGSDVMTVALKLATSSHFPLPKIHTFRTSFPNGHNCGSCPKTRSLCFSSLKWSAMCTEIGNELTLSVAKRFALFVHLSQIARQVISSEPKTNDQMCGCTVLLPIKKKKRIKNYWNRLIATHLDTATQWSFYFYHLKDQLQARCLKFLFC